MKQLQGDSTALRLVTAGVLLPLLALIVWLPGMRVLFTVLIILLAALGTREFFRLARQAGIDVPHRLGIVLAVAPVVGAGAGLIPHALLLLALFILTTVYLFSGRHTIAGLATSVFGLVYVGYCASFFVVMHQIESMGPGLVTFLVFAIGCSDTGAYVVGKALGRHKLAPQISPNKTIEGSLAALVCAMISAGVLYAAKEWLQWPYFPDWPVAVYVFAAFCLSVVGQLGDLIESLLKRNAGVKDSGRLFPGHGGVLDRCDAFLFGGPMLYCFVYVMSVWAR